MPTRCWAVRVTLIHYNTWSNFKCIGYILTEEVLPKETMDKCASVTCGYHSECEVIDGNATCVCMKGCTRELDPKCGTDNVTYVNPCELRRTSCEQQREILVVKDGECNVGRLKYVFCAENARESLSQTSHFSRDECIQNNVWSTSAD